MYNVETEAPMSENTRALSTVASRRALVFRASAMVLFVGCGGGEGKQRGETTSATATSATEAGPSVMPSPEIGLAPPGASPDMLAYGDSIFHGLAGGGTCLLCHGIDANGTTLAPSLTDSKWLTGDGSYEFIQKRVTQGIPNPTPPFTNAMPPMGGTQLSPEQIRAVSAYVYFISHKGA
jgi:mono/diheme cytochrome c family protein